MGEVWNPYESPLSLEETISRLEWSYPALVKNYMVIIRTIPWQKAPSISVAVRGSRALYSGGQWDRHLARMLARFYRRAEVHLYDINEIESMYVIKERGSEVTVRRIRALLNTSGQVPEPYDQYVQGIYDVLVDDAYVGLQGTQDYDPVTKWWSKKKHDFAYDEYLHTSEGRQFSHQPESIPSPCHCLLCKAIANTSPTAEVFMQLRQDCIDLGAGPCTQPAYVANLDHRDILRSIYTGRHEAVTESEKRQVIDVRHIQQVKQQGNIFVPVQKGDSLGLSLRRIDETYTTKDVKGWWKDQNVAYVGCEPSLLIGESYRPLPNKSSFAADPSIVVFVKDKESIGTVFADVIWCTDDVPSYARTGREHRGYHEQKKIMPVFNLQVHVPQLDVEEKCLDIQPPGSDWKRYDLANNIVAADERCLCRFAGDDPRPCEDHMLVRAILTQKQPPRRKRRKKGKAVFAPGFYSPDGDRWYELRGGSEDLESALFYHRVPWKI